MPNATSGTMPDTSRFKTYINASTETNYFAAICTIADREDVFEESTRENVMTNLAPTNDPQVEWLLSPQGLLSYEGSLRPLRSDWIENALDQLDDMQTVVDGWNGYSAPAPSTLAINNARQFVYELYTVVPSALRVAPSAIGGVGITLSKREKAVYVEFYNDGSIYRMLINNGIDTDVQPVRSDAHNLGLLASEATDYIDN